MGGVLCWRSLLSGSDAHGAVRSSVRTYGAGGHPRDHGRFPVLSAHGMGMSTGRYSVQARHWASVSWLGSEAERVA